MMKAAIIQAAAAADRWAARVRRRLVGERPGLVVLVFHAVGARREDLGRGALDPTLCVSLEQLRACLEYYLGHGFTAVGVNQLIEGLDPERNHVMFTFDDGYANNALALRLFEEARVPVLWSIATGYTRSGESFWWDVLHRGMTAAGATPAQIAQEKNRLTAVAPCTIRDELIARFGAAALMPVGDADRPLSAAELREMAQHPLVTLANHTVHHTLLAGLDAATLQAEIAGAQQDLLEFTGISPTAMVYPYGRYDPATIAACGRLGFRVAFAGNHAKVRLPDGLAGDAALRVPRCMIYPHKPIEPQCQATHLDWKPSWTLRRWASRGGRAGGP